MNLVIIPSVIENAILSPHLTAEERLDQTRITIESVKKKIPNSYIVIIEGGRMTDDITSSFQKFGVDEIFYTNVSGLGKSAGEMELLCSYMSSEFFSQIEDKCNSISKISGRYYLTDEFSFDEDYIIYCTDISWSGQGACSTRYWKTPGAYIPTLVSKMLFLRDHINTYVDIEHAFYAQDIIPQDKIIKEKLVGVTGIVSPFGKLENG
jgi:hypothetical protein